MQLLSFIVEKNEVIRFLFKFQAGQIRPCWYQISTKGLELIHSFFNVRRNVRENVRTAVVRLLFSNDF